MISLSQAKALTVGTVLYHARNRNADGSPQRWRVSGKPKTWKRSPQRVEVPVKHGLYMNFRIRQEYLHMFSFTEREALFPPPGLNRVSLQGVADAANDLYGEIVGDEATHADVAKGMRLVERIAESWGYTFNQLWKVMHDARDGKRRKRDEEELEMYARANRIIDTFDPATPPGIIRDTLEDAGFDPDFAAAMVR